MVKKSEKLGLILLLCLILCNISGNQALANNTLNQVDVRKNSSDGLEFTLYTSSPYADNVVVSKKSDNKYVILMPNVNGTTNSRPDFSAAKDIISDVNVRSIEDGQGGYTKVTVITNRPVDIKTNTAKSAPISQGQREYRALIAQQKANSNSVSANAEQKQSMHAPAFKLPEIQPTKNTADTTKTTTSDLTQKINKPAPVVQKTISTALNNTKKEQILPAVNKKQSDNKIANATTTNLNTTKNTNIKMVSNIKTEANQTQETKSISSITKTEQNNNIIEETDTQTANIEEVSKNIGMATATAVAQNINKPAQPNIFADIKTRILGNMPEDMPSSIAIILIPFLCIIILFNIIKASVRKSQTSKQRYTKSTSSGQTGNTQYDNIINNENLNWQEKYQQYMDASEPSTEDKKIENEQQYKIIAQKQKQAKIAKAKQVQQKQSSQTRNNQSAVTHTHPVQSKRATATENIEKFERLIQSSPNIEKTNLEEDIASIQNNQYAQSPVLDETNSIHNEINRTIKLKAFAEKAILEETQRNKKIKHRRVQFEAPKEAPHVNLGYSQLHSNTRMMKNANLSVSDLIAKSGKLLNIPEPEVKSQQNYDTISLDEYFSIMNNDKANVTSSLSDVVAEHLGNMKAPSPQQKNRVSNPIETLRNETRENYFSGLIVKSGYNIDKDRGFYLVSLEGKSAIIGKIGEEIFVLKRFNKNVTKPLQVRMDNPNVYMVKADNFKSLVEVQKYKMGVLIEL